MLTKLFKDNTFCLIVHNQLWRQAAPIASWLVVDLQNLIISKFTGREHWVIREGLVQDLSGDHKSTKHTES